MLKITKYLGITVLIVSIAGFWYPKLGYFLLIVFATLLAIAPFRGRWFCGNLCPRGSFNDFWLGKITFNKKIPNFFRSLWLRIPIFIIMMGFMIFRLISVEKTVDKIGMVFVIMCLVTTLIAILFGIMISPRTWCSFCPMGTVQSWLGKGKYTIKFNKSKCIDCDICNKICPMQLTVNQITHNPDCIKCERCIKACPKKALKF